MNNPQNINSNFYAGVGTAERLMKTKHTNLPMALSTILVIRVEAWVTYIALAVRLFMCARDA